MLLSSQKAARELAAYIHQAEPAEYSCKCYCIDGPTELEAGVKNGQPCYREKEMPSAYRI